ncbi:MAG: hypothetical protein H7Y38_04310 [Armatimonadetes bacterium]|nr:hypothetical protein [Armatimonadota bacterium]
MMKNWQAAALAVFLGAPAFAAPPVPTLTAPKPVAPATRPQIFDFVWRKVRDGYYDPKMNGVNWNAVRAKYLPKVNAAKDEAEFYVLLNAMLAELKESHFGAIPPSALGAAKQATPGMATGVPGETGITAQLVDNQLTVVRVTPGSAGAEGGVLPGYRITAIKEKPVAPAIEAIVKADANADPRYAVWATMQSVLGGVVGTPYPLTVLDATGAEKTLTVTPRKSVVPKVTFAALPPIPADIETRTLAGGVGYVRFSIFLMPLLQPVKDAVTDFAAKGAPAIIFDLRGNRGGLGVMANSIAGTLTAKEFNLGTMKTREMAQKFPVVPQSPRFAGKVVILVDEGSVSTSEIMAGGLQEAGRATVIGRQTAGAVLPSQIVTLPDGGRLQFVFGDFRTPKGVLLEGRGVTPDITVPLSPALLAASASGDPVLDAALNFLNTPIVKETQP